ncbi:MAG: hypothetical protein HQL38_19900 [Alphaproteobacteria bacterium]|nr:hypothetical protein [Alphaproteobacteria bacterium]
MPPAMAALLKRNGFDLAAGPADADFAVEGVVTTKPGPPGTKMLEIVWTVRDRQGLGLGTVEQANPVPIALLDGSWGEMASLIAEGATEGVVAILRAQQDGNAAPASPFTD